MILSETIFLYLVIEIIKFFESLCLKGHMTLTCVQIRLLLVQCVFLDLHLPCRCLLRTNLNFFVCSTFRVPSAIEFRMSEFCFHIALMCFA
jgi:hypothetical protein